MSANPYENEPGFENARSTDDKKNMEAYNAKVEQLACTLTFIPDSLDRFDTKR